MSILYGAIAVLCNILFWFCMYGIQAWEIRTERIPDLSPHNRITPALGFLGIQHYHTTSWGDVLVLSMIDFAVADALLKLSWSQLAWYFGAGACITIYFHLREWKGPLHKPDWAYPRKGSVSFGGVVHMGYFFVQVSMVIMGAYLLFFDPHVLSSDRTFPLVLGIAMYLFAISLDMGSGRWAKTSHVTRG